MNLQKLLKRGAGDLGAPPAPEGVEGMVVPRWLNEAMVHAGLPQPIRKQLRLPRWHYIVVALVDEKDRGIIGVDAENGREVS